MEVYQRNRHYFVRKLKNDGRSHALDCVRHDKREIVAALRGWSSTTLQENEDGTLRIRLAFQLLARVAGGRRVDEAKRQTVYRTPRRAIAVPVASRASLLGLLHLGWTVAELNAFDPRAADRQNPWTHLRRAFVTIRTDSVAAGQWGLSSLLMLPQDASINQKSANFRTLENHETQTKVLLAFDLGDPRVAAWKNGDLDVFRVFGVPVRLPTAVLERAREQFPRSSAHGARGGRVIAFGVARVGRRGPGSEARQLCAVVERLALQGVTKHWIPVDSSHEEKLLLALADAGRSFYKPLRFDAQKFFGFHPDAVLTDVERGIFPLEVYGMQDEEYVAQSIFKEEFSDVVYGCAAHWSWRVREEELSSALARLWRLAPRVR
jgi:hypothetical protein